jgi:hypothetical protein
MRNALRISCLGVLIGILAGFAASAAPAAAANLSGTWTGSAVINGGASNEGFTLVLEKKAASYSGRVTTASGLAVEAEIRDVVFKDGKLSFKFDLNGNSDPDVITFEMTVEADAMTGTWSSSSGQGDKAEAKKQK